MPERAQQAGAKVAAVPRRPEALPRDQGCWRRSLAVGVACFGCLLGLDGCASLYWLAKGPEVKEVSVAVVGGDFRKADLEVSVEVLNPRSGALTLAGYDYDLQIEGRPFLNGMSEAVFELKPKAVTVVRIPLSVEFADVFKQLASLKGRSDVAYDLAVALTVKTLVGEVRLPFEKKGRVPVLAVPEVRLQAVTVRELSLEGLALEGMVEVVTDGASVTLTGLTYALSLNDVPVATGIVTASQARGPGVSLVRIPVQVDVAKARAALGPVLAASTQLAYKLTGEASFSSPFGPLSFPFTHAGKIKPSR